MTFLVLRLFAINHGSPHPEVPMAATQAANPAEAAAFKPPFRGRTVEEILLEVGLGGSKPASLAGRLAYAMETGDYPRLASLLARAEAEAESNGDGPARQAWLCFRECGELARQHEEAYVVGSARNNSHHFWSNVWERNNRLRAQSFRLAADCPRSEDRSRVPELL
jgi:hypothetical protein